MWPALTSHQCGRSPVSCPGPPGTNMRISGYIIVGEGALKGKGHLCLAACFPSHVSITSPSPTWTTHLSRHTRLGVPTYMTDGGLSCHLTLKLQRSGEAQRCMTCHRQLPHARRRAAGLGGRACEAPHGGLLSVSAWPAVAPEDLLPCQSRCCCEGTVQIWPTSTRS